MPSDTLAAAITSSDTFASATYKLVGLAESLVLPIMFVLAFVFFLVGMLRYFFSQNEENRANGRQFVLWSIIGFVVLFSVWGIVNLFLGILK